ncbi:hypothetical protein J1N35_026783 [Gossypium stocksii]|uniref:Uncharacterized protein n=1 Tax=Gossypium stocksii TaxID=47602 RepID=A0A9D3V9K6_9ROSI|nr:hypothetical protein J1N35_026783 [Gossypium stocksii]
MTTIIKLPELVLTNRDQEEKLLRISLLHSTMDGISAGQKPTQYQLGLLIYGELAMEREYSFPTSPNLQDARGQEGRIGEKLTGQRRPNIHEQARCKINCLGVQHRNSKYLVSCKKLLWIISIID